MTETKLKAHEVADMLGVTVQTVSNYCADGVFPNAFKLGNSKTHPWRIPQSDVDAYLRERRKESQGQTAPASTRRKATTKKRARPVKG
jgi:predicted DNA-binding transcriptional regulator AlpA